MVSKNNHLKVEGYTDAGWLENVLDRKSTSSYFMFVGGNLVTWRSKKKRLWHYQVLKQSFVEWLRVFVRSSS